jgi:hypothetical protein
MAVPHVLIETNANCLLAGLQGATRKGAPARKPIPATISAALPSSSGIVFFTLFPHFHIVDHISHAVARSFAPIASPMRNAGAHFDNLTGVEGCSELKRHSKVLGFLGRGSYAKA